MKYQQIAEELLQLREREEAGIKDLPTLLLKCRHDFLTFARFVTEGRFKPFAVHKKIAEELTLIGSGKNNRLMLSCPPRTGKSLMAGQLFLPWAMGRNPLAQHIVCSYGTKLSLDITRGVLTNMCTERYQAVFPEVELRSKEKITEIRNLQGGVIRVTSVKSNITGLGFGYLENDCPPGILLMDDLLADGYSKQIKNSTWNWLIQQLLTRALPNNAQLMIGTRFADDDMHARLLENQKDLWKQVNIPALSIASGNADPLGRRTVNLSHWPEFFPVSKLKEIRSANERNFQCLYQGIPTNAESGLFAASDIVPTEIPAKFTTKFATIDTATSKSEQSDDSSLAIFGIDLLGNLWILNIIYGKYDFDELTTIVRENASNHGVRHLVIENANIGKALGQTLKKELSSLSIEYVKPAKDKYTRASQVLTDFRSNRVQWSNSIHNIEAIQKQFAEFPFAEDDVVDSVVYGILHWQQKYKKVDKQVSATNGSFFRSQSRA